MSKIPQCIVKPQKQSVFPMFWVPLHRLVISRAGDRTLASKYCAINSSIFSVLLCTPCTIRQISRVCNGALGGIYWPLVEDILPESGYSTPLTVQQCGPSKLWGRSTLSACWGEAAKVAGMLAPQSTIKCQKGEKSAAFLFWYLLALSIQGLAQKSM